MYSNEKIKPLKGYECFDISSSLLHTKILNCQATARTITQHNNKCNVTKRNRLKDSDL